MTAKKKVVVFGDPSYTSNDQKWNGAIESLINKLIQIKKNPIETKFKFNIDESTDTRIEAVEFK